MFASSNQLTTTIEKRNRNNTSYDKSTSPNRATKLMLGLVKYNEDQIAGLFVRSFVAVFVERIFCGRTIFLNHCAPVLFCFEFSRFMCVCVFVPIVYLCFALFSIRLRRCLGCAQAERRSGTLHILAAAGFVRFFRTFVVNSHFVAVVQFTRSLLLFVCSVMFPFRFCNS